MYWPSPWRPSNRSAKGKAIAVLELPLETVGDVQREMTKVYRAMRKGRISTAAGNALTQALMCLSKVTQVAVEHRPPLSNDQPAQGLPLAGSWPGGSVARSGQA